MNPNTLLDRLRVRFGPSIPSAPRRGDSAPWNVLFNRDLFEAIQETANRPEYRYHGDFSALVRHACSLFIQVLAEDSGQDVSAITFESELLRQEREDKDYLAFVNYTQTALKAAEEYARTVPGRRESLRSLHRVLDLIGKQQSRPVKLLMEAHLTSNTRFVKMVREVGDDRLKSWLEVAI